MTVVQQEKRTVAIERDACIAGASRLRALLSSYRDACNHVTKRRIDKGVRSKAGCAATASKAEDEVSLYLRGFVLSTENSVEHIAHARNSANELSSIVVEMFRNVKGELEDIVSGQFVISDGSLDVSRVSSSHDGLLLPWIDAAPD